MSAKARRIQFLAAGCLATAALAGCSSTPSMVPTGFISDYDNLEVVRDNWMRYIAPEMRNYDTFIVDPIQIRADSDLDAAARADLANYMSESFERVLRDAGYTLTDQAGPNVARVRLAITGIQKSTWYLNLHPAMKATGAGLGGAAMECEVIDSVTGQQLGAAIRSDVGSGLELDTFDDLDDVKDAIDTWCESAAERLREIREGRPLTAS